MANTFKAQIKNNGVYEDISGIAVFPFSFGELLDERLDEAYLRIVKDTTKEYPPLTEFKITPSPQGEATAKEYYYVVANDNSRNFPIGTRYYSHEIYLLERTKLLEGILCQSITFTNSRNINYTEQDVIPKITHIEESIPVAFYLNSGITPPKKKDDYISIPSAFSIGDKFIEALEAEFDENTYRLLPSIYRYTDSNGNDIYFYTQLDILGDGNDEVEEGYKGNASYTLSKETLSSFSSLSLNYTICYERNGVETVADIDYIIVLINPPFKPYSITDCVTRVLELAEPLRAMSEKPRYRLEGVTYTPILAPLTNTVVKYVRSIEPNSVADYYDKIIAPDFTMSECTLREQLKIIGGFIHGEPFLDENDVIHFLDYGQTRQYKTTNPYFLKTLSRDINQYCTEVRSNAQNLVNSLGYAKGVVIDPCSNLFRSLRCEESYVRITENNGVMQTSLPIYNVAKLECGIIDVVANPKVAPTLYDITPYVFESTIYGANLSSYSNTFPNSKSYALYYTLGSKNVQGLFFRAENAVSTAAFSRFAISNILSVVSGEDAKEIDDKIVNYGAWEIVYRITYKPIIPSALVSHGKQYYISGETPFTQINNQSGNLIETDAFGENIKGVAARLGNVEETRTYFFKDLDNIPPVGYMLGGYAISAVNTEYMPNHIKTTVGLTKDFNRISQYVGVSSIKRLYEVSERQTYRRNVLYKETLIVGGSEEAVDGEARTSFFALDGFYDVFAPTTEQNPAKSLKITGVCAKMFKKGNVGNPFATKILPVSSLSFGNAMTFSFSFKDNYSAGNIARVVTIDNAHSRFQDDTRYTDYFGRIYWIGLSMFPSATPNTTTGEGAYSFAYSLPEYTANAYTFKSEFDTFIRPLLLRKDNREIISITCELEIKSADKNLIIGSGLADTCRYVSESTGAEKLEIHLVKDGIYKFDKQYIEEEGDYHFPPVENGFPFVSVNATRDSQGGINGITLPKIEVPDAVEGEYLGWVLCTASQKEEQPFTNETGEIEPVSIENGRKILLSFDASDAPIKAGDTILSTSANKNITFKIE